jgi:hypothetical protein
MSKQWIQARTQDRRLHTNSCKSKTDDTINNHDTNGLQLNNLDGTIHAWFQDAQESECHCSPRCDDLALSQSRTSNHAYAQEERQLDPAEQDVMETQLREFWGRLWLCWDLCLSGGVLDRCRMAKRAVLFVVDVVVHVTTPCAAIVSALATRPQIANNICKNCDPRCKKKKRRREKS